MSEEKECVVCGKLVPHGKDACEDNCNSQLKEAMLRILNEMVVPANLEKDRQASIDYWQKQ